MSKKKLNLNFSYDAPVTLTFVILISLLFVLNTFVFKNAMTEKFLTACTSKDGVQPFNFKNIVSYLRLFFHIFGCTNSTVLVSDMIFILLLGPQNEERYGSVVIGIMFFISAMFTGVLNACFCKNVCCGAGPVVFMLIILNAMMMLSKKKIPVTTIAVIILFVFMEYSKKNPNGWIGIITILAGGLCGSLIAFMASPKGRQTRKENSTLYAKEVKTSTFDRDKKIFNRKKSKPSSDDEETVVGTLQF